jgi:hypothetical protein
MLLQQRHSTARQKMLLPQPECYRAAWQEMLSGVSNCTLAPKKKREVRMELVLSIESTIVQGEQITPLQ